MEINGNQRISMIFTVSELFIRIYGMCECWEAHSNFEVDIIASYMHSKLCEQPVSKKELTKSSFNPLNKNTQTISNYFDYETSVRHPYNR